MRERLISTAEVADKLAQVRTELAGKSGHTRRQYVLRLIRRLEQRDGERYTKRVGSRVYVSQFALETLLGSDTASYSRLGSGLADLRQKHDQLQRQVNGHGSRIRLLEKKQALTDRYIADMAALEKEAAAHEQLTNGSP